MSAELFRKYMELKWFYCGPPTHREQCMDGNTNSLPFPILITKQRIEGAIQNILHRLVGPRGRIFSSEKCIDYTGEAWIVLQYCLQIPERCKRWTEFIALKERQINRLIHVNENLECDFRDGVVERLHPHVSN